MNPGKASRVLLLLAGIITCAAWSSAAVLWFRLGVAPRGAVHAAGLQALAVGFGVC